VEGIERLCGFVETLSGASSTFALTIKGALEADLFFTETHAKRMYHFPQTLETVMRRDRLQVMVT